MSDEKEKSGQCGWIAFAFLIVFLQGYLSLGMPGGVSAVDISGFFLYTRATDIVGRMHVLIGIVSGLLLSAMGAMIFAIGFSAIVAKLIRRIKIFLHGAACLFRID